MTNPQIVMPDYGVHNRDIRRSQQRLEKSKSYRDLSTIAVMPVPRQITQDDMVIRITGVPVKVFAAIRNLMTPMNQKFVFIPIEGMEVCAAYETAMEMILNNPDLSKYRYLLTIEWDNIPPPDGLLKLYEDMDDYDAVGGLYWTKGEAGQPMIYGNPTEMPRNFIPQMPQIDKLQECNGLGMGFNLFKLEMFKDKRWIRPWFKTQQELIPGQGFRGFSQDLYFYDHAKDLGYKFACDTRIKVGHLDLVNDIVW